MKIKEYFQQIEPKVAPTPTAQPELGVARGIGQLGQALSGASSDWEGVAKAYAEIDQKNKNLEMMTDVEGKLLDLKSQNAKIVEQLHENPDPENYIKNWQEAFDTNAQNIAGEIKDINTRSRFNLELNRYKQIETVNQIHAGYLLRHDEQFGKVKDILQKLGDEGNKERGIEVINGAVANGLIKESQASDTRVVFLKQIDATNERLRNELQKQIDKAAETNADLYLAREYGENYDAQIKALGKPEIYTKLKLTAEQANNLANTINNRKIRTTAEREAIYKETNETAFQADHQNRLTLEMVAEFVELKMLDVPRAEAWRNRLEAKMKEKDGKIKTDWAVYNRLNKLASENPDKAYVEKEIMASIPRLEETHIHELLNINQKKVTEVTRQSQARMDARHLIEKTIFPGGPMEKTFATGLSEKRLSDSWRVLDNAISEADTKGKPLTSKEIDIIGRELAQGASRTYPEMMQEFKEYTTGKMKPKVPIKGETIKRKPGETITEYLKRTGQK